MLNYLWLTSFIIAADQLSKWLMVSTLSLYETIAVFPGFNLTMAHNYGAAFSFLANAGGWQKWFFIVLASTVSVALMIWLFKLSKTAKLEALSISLILGGAIGNLIDRIYYGYVVDFLDVFYNSHHWPAFNIADAAICIGAGLLIIDSFLTKPQQDKTA